MAFGLFRKRLPEPVAPAADARVPQEPAAPEAAAGHDSADDSARAEKVETE